jgi:hypothetical protein
MGIGMRRKENRALKNDPVGEEQNHFLLNLVEAKITHGKTLPHSAAVCGVQMIKEILV